jgi:biopolymer transport protein ExbD
MMDMFTIILIFLLFSFSEKPETISLKKGLDLPKSSVKTDYQDTVKIELSKDELRLNNEIVAKVVDQRIEGLVMDSPQSSALYQRLKAENEKVSPSADGEEQAPHVLFLCDKSHSFRTINTIIKTAAIAGYPNFQFAVLKAK